MINVSHSFILIAVMAITTIVLRFLPFAMFSKKTPKWIIYLGDVLPYSIIAMLVVYCLKDMNFTKASYGIPEIISVAFVVLLHKWKHNTLFSILGGTICYMFLVAIASGGSCQ